MSLLARRIEIHRSRAMKLFLEVTGIAGLVLILAIFAMSVPSLVRYIRISRM
jgi:hypothetical protein